MCNTSDKTVRRGVLGRVLIGVLLAVAMAGGCGKRGGGTGEGQKKDVAVPVLLKGAKVQRVQRMVEVVGTLYGDEEAVISAKVPGRLAAIYKDMGDRAEALEALALIDPVDYELAKKQKEVAISQALSQLDLDKPPSADFDVTIVPTIKRTKLKWDNAKAKMERGRQLHDQKQPLMSDQEFADLRTAAEVAKSDYDVEIITAQTMLGEIKMRLADMRMAEQKLADTVIRAPAPTTLPVMIEGTGGISGAVAKQESKPCAVSGRMASVGEYLKEGAMLFRVVKDDPIKLKTYVREQFVGDVKVGQKVEVRVAAYDRAFWGVVSRVNPQISKDSRTFEIEVVVANSERLLRAGAFTRAWVQTRVEDEVVFVPQEAVVSFAGVNKVFTVKDGKAVEAVVEAGDSREGWTEIVKGMSGREEVVVMGQSKLAMGVAVRIRQAAGEGSTTRAAGVAAVQER